MFQFAVNNRYILYIHQNFLEVVVPVIIIDQWNQTARLYEIQVTVIYSHAILCDVKVPCKECCL